MARAVAAERAAQRLQRSGHLARDHPEGVAFGLCKLRQRQQVLVGEHLGVRIVEMHGLEHRADCLRLALGAQDLALLVALGAQDAALFLALRSQDLGLAEPFGGEDGRALLPLGPHLLLHRVHDALGRINRLDLHPGHPDSPLAGSLVKHPAQHVVDVVPRGQGLFQVHGTDHAAQHGRGELLDRLDVVDDLVVGRPGVGDLEEQHGVDEHDQVVLGDDRLALEGHHLLAEVDQRLDPVHERDDEVHPRLQGLAVPAEALDVARARLRHDAHRPGHNDEHQNDHDDRGDGRGYSCFHDYSLG